MIMIYIIATILMAFSTHNIYLYEITKNLTFKLFFHQHNIRIITKNSQISH